MRIGEYEINDDSNDGDGSLIVGDYKSLQDVDLENFSLPDQESFKNNIVHKSSSPGANEVSFFVEAKRLKSAEGANDLSMTPEAKETFNLLKHKTIPFELFCEIFKAPETGNDDIVFIPNKYIQNMPDRDLNTIE